MTEIVPTGYLSPRQVAARTEHSYEWVRRRLDPTHPDAIPHKTLPTTGNPRYLIPVDEFEAWEKTRGKP